MRNYSLSEIKKLADNPAYKHISLVNAQGDTLISYNALLKDKKNKISEVESRLKSDGTQDGLYIVLAKSSARKSVQPDQYPYLKGDKTNAPQLSEPLLIKPEPQKEVEHVLTYKGALELEKEKNRLELENSQLRESNEFLKKRISELESELMDLEEEEEEEESDGLSEAAKPGGFLSQMLPGILAVANEHFSIEREKLKLKEKQLLSSENKKVFPQQAQRSDNELEQFAAELLQLSKTNPEQYKLIINQIYGNDTGAGI